MVIIMKTKLLKGSEKDNLVNREIDLLSNGGLDDYGKLHVKIGLLTIDDYRKYRKAVLKNLKIVGGGCLHQNRPQQVMAITMFGMSIPMVT